jgi:hypothetical protein
MPSRVVIPYTMRTHLMAHWDYVAPNGVVGGLAAPSVCVPQGLGNEAVVMRWFGTWLRLVLVLVLVALPTTFLSAPKAHAWYDTTWLTVDSFYWDADGYTLDAEYQIPGNAGGCGKLVCSATISLLGSSGLPHEIFSAETPLYTEPDKLRVTKSGSVGVPPRSGMLSLMTTMDLGGCCTSIGTPVESFVIAMLTDDEIREVVGPSISSNLNPCDAFPLVGAHREMDVTDEQQACNTAFQDAVKRAGSGGALLEDSKLLFYFLKSVRDGTSNAFFHNWLTFLPVKFKPPTEAPNVTVARLHSGGYQVSWTPVPGATSYIVSIDGVQWLEATTLPAMPGYMFAPSFAKARPIASVSGSELTYTTPDLHAPELSSGRLSPRFLVTPVNNDGRGPDGLSYAGCAEGYFLAARGSGQNPQTNPVGYGSGLGDRSERVYEDLRARLRLSRSQFQANAISYPAVGVENIGFKELILGDGRRAYLTSERQGEAALKAQLLDIVDRCPASKIVLSGYSQGAHAVGDVFQAWPRKANVLGVLLLADAARDPKDRNITSLPRPLIPPGMAIDFDTPRPAFTGLTDAGQVESWCNSADDVCTQWLGDGLTFHPPDAYACYEKWAARNLAARAANSGWIKSADITDPTTCRMRQYM